MHMLTFDTLDSTNAEAHRRLASGGLPTPACIVAREQTAGRGTKGRAWCSPRHAGIYLSVIDRPQAGAAAATVLYTLAAGVACVEAIDAVAGVVAELRPVNDLWVNGRKLGGILVEAVAEDGALTSIVTGVGINVRAVPRETAADGPAPISLEELMTPPAFAALENDALARALADRIVAWTATAARGEDDLVRRAWAARAIAGADPPATSASARTPAPPHGA